MDISTSEAIVLNAIKYGDSSLIVKCFTKQLGIKSYLVRGVLKSKKGKIKPAYFQPLTQLKISGKYNNKGHLNSISDIEINYHYQSVFSSVIKQSIVLFISEILGNSIQEEECNIALYEYLKTAFIWLDTHKINANFHLIFLFNLTKYLGFFPDTSDSHKQVFNLTEGRFLDNETEKFSISSNDLVNFKKLFETNFDTGANILFNKKDRQQILKILIQYFELHLTGFKKPKSLSVLESVFN